MLRKIEDLKAQVSVIKHSGSGYVEAIVDYSENDIPARLIQKGLSCVRPKSIMQTVNRGVMVE